MNISPLEIYQAKKRISPHVTYTPLVRAQALSDLCEAEIRCKLETMQPTGAFKLRGATNAILRLNEAQRKRGVVAVSTGNHGRGVAYAAREQGVRAVICLTSLVPENKVEAIKSLGADVRIVGNSQDEAELEANRLTEEERLIPISPFDHPDVIAGQGTIGLELLEDFPELNCVVVPLSGGGLIAGIALVLKAASPKIRVVGVTMENGPAMVLSLEAGKPVEVEEEESLADSLGGGIGLENRYTLSLVQELVDETLLVSEDEIGQAIQYVFQTQRMVLEGGAAVGTAALLAKKLEVQGQNVALIYSGNNIAEKTLRKVIDS